MPELKIYKGRPCYVRQACLIEYLDALTPDSEMFVMIDNDEQTKTIFMDIIDVEVHES